MIEKKPSAKKPSKEQLKLQSDQDKLNKERAEFQAEKAALEEIQNATAEKIQQLGLADSKAVAKWGDIPKGCPNVAQWLRDNDLLAPVTKMAVTVWHGGKKKQVEVMANDEGEAIRQALKNLGIRATHEANTKVSRN